MTAAEDLQRIAEQEKTLVLKGLDNDFAWTLGTHLRGLAEERGLPIVIDVRRFGQPLFYAAMPGTAPDNFEWIRRKSNCVARFHRSSYAVGLKLDPNGPSLAEKFGLSAADYAEHGGAFPLSVEGTGIVGSVAVSGLPQRDDHGLVVEALCGLLGKDHAALKLADR